MPKFISKAWPTSSINPKSYIVHLGFTLIELLVVISLIGVLTTLVMANLNSGRGRSRDAQRMSDMRNIATALRLYYNDRGIYPGNTAGYLMLACGSYTTPSACGWNAAWAVGTVTYMSTLPKDPSSNQSYRYTQTGAGDGFTLSACFENRSNDKGVTTTDTTWCPSGWMYQITQ